MYYNNNNNTQLKLDQTIWPALSIEHSLSLIIDVLKSLLV